MKTRSNLNIDVYLKDEFIYVRFDLLNNFESGNNKLSTLENLTNVANKFANEQLSPADMRSEKTEVMGKKIIQHILQASPKEPHKVNSLKCAWSLNQVIINNEIDTDTRFNHMAVVYRLSNIPHVLINWLASFSIYINDVNNRSILNHIQFSDHTPFESIRNIINFNNLFLEKNYSDYSIRMLMEKMLNFKDKVIGYQDALIDLNKLYYYYMACRQGNRSKPLLQCLSDITRYDLFYGEQFEKLTSAKDSHEKEMIILSSTLTPDVTYKKLEFLFMLELLISKERILLFEPCLGKRAHDNNPYQMAHTELMLMYFAEFHLFDDGRIGMINLDSNPAYIEYYAKGKMNYDILHQELDYLMKCLGLELEPGCDYHKDKQVMFTLDCSLKLRNLGLHLTADYSKNLFIAYNKWAFFTRIKLAGDNVFTQLPTEILDKILVNTNHSYERFYNKQLYPSFFQAVKLGKERGTIEHKEVVERKFHIPMN